MECYRLSATECGHDLVTDSPTVLPQSAHWSLPGILRMMFMALCTGSKAEDELEVGGSVAEQGVEGEMGDFLLLGLECFRASSVVSWRADTHEFICCSLMVWKRCSLDGVRTLRGGNEKWWVTN